MNKDIFNNCSTLPIFDSIQELKATLAQDSAVLVAPPGSGKTTCIPLTLLNEPWLQGRKIIILEPRRLAARAAATRMSDMLGEEVGNTVGYQVRFDRKISTRTRIEVVTEGILTRRLQKDPDLPNVGLIIFDEFHERSIHTDLTLAFCLEICELKDDLKLLVMSATLDASSVAELMGGVPIIKGEGQSYPVDIEYYSSQQRGSISTIAAQATKKVLREKKGDILVFLPGVGEIRSTLRILKSEEDDQTKIIPLFGNLTIQEQAKAILPDPKKRRKVILATSIAESSLTIDGISNVVDSGWARRPRFNPANGLTFLETVRVSKASSRQRSGRAGRLGPGYCLRIWTKQEEHNLPPFHPPEILTANLTQLALELAAWGISDPNQLRWLDPPRSDPYKNACEFLMTIGALSPGGEITNTGRRLTELPLSPRLGFLLLMAAEKHQTSVALDLAAILTHRDIMEHENGHSADLTKRIEILKWWRQKGKSVKQLGGIPERCRQVNEAAVQYDKLIKGKTNKSSDKTIGNLLAYAYPDRIAQRRPGQRNHYLLSNGRGATLHPSDALTAYEYLIIPELDAGKKEGNVFLAAPLELEDLREHHPELFHVEKCVSWHEKEKRIKSVKETCLGKIIISEGKWQNPPPNLVRTALLNGIKKMGLDCLPWTKEAKHLLARISFLARMQPETEWPECDETALQMDLSWLEPYLAGVNSFEKLKLIDLHSIFLGMLDWEKQKTLDKDAPATIKLPTGSTRKIDYSMDGSPVLAVRIQEMYGESISPTVCSGKVPIVLHLLSPAHRPIQITSDLPGFWKGSYAAVKKDLSGRYPKHFWPDDPATAPATNHIKRLKKGKK